MNKQKPCDNCPFRADRPFKGFDCQRAIDLHNGLMQDAGFPCHKTTKDVRDGGRVVVPTSTQCVGAAIYTEKLKPGGMMENLSFRMSAMCNPNDPIHPNKVDMAAPVCNSLEELIENACY